MERTSAEITRYTSGDFEIDVADTGTMFEAWIGHKVIVIKELMFAVPHENTTKEEFLAYKDSLECSGDRIIYSEDKAEVRL